MINSEYRYLEEQTPIIIKKENDNIEVTTSLSSPIISELITYSRDFVVKGVVSNNCCHLQDIVELDGLKLIEKDYLERMIILKMVFKNMFNRHITV